MFHLPQMRQPGLDSTWAKTLMMLKKSGIFSKRVHIIPYCLGTLDWYTSWSACVSESMSSLIKLRKARISVYSEGESWLRQMLRAYANWVAKRLSLPLFDRKTTDSNLFFNQTCFMSWVLGEGLYTYTFQEALNHCQCGQSNKYSSCQFGSVLLMKSVLERPKLQRSCQ